MALTKATELSQLAGTLTVDSSGNATLTGTVTASNFITGSAALLDSSRTTALVDSAYVQSRADSDYIKTVQYGDNERLKFGAGTDLEIYHNASNSIVEDAGAGQLLLRTNGNKIELQNSSLETMANFISNSAVELYYDNNLRLITTTDGIRVTGGTGDANLIIEADTDNVNENDNATLTLKQDGGHITGVFGLAGDNTTYIQVHHLYDFQVKNTSGELFIEAQDSGAVNLYYANNKKFETTSTGATITGEVLADSATVNIISVPDGSNTSNRINIGSSDDLKIFHNGTNSFLRDDGTGALFLQTSRFIVEDLGSSKWIDVGANAQVELYYDGTKKLETTSTGATITGEVVADSATISIISVPDGGATGNRINIGSGDDLKIYHDGSHSWIRDQGTGHLYITTNGDFISLGSGGAQSFGKFTSNQVELYYNSTKRFQTTDSGSKVFGSLVVTDDIQGPSTMYIDPSPVDSDAGTLVIRGNLQVDGITTTVNSTTVSINDKNIVLADSAANASQADGAGITVNGASATLNYASSGDKWVFNKAPYYNTARLITTDDKLIDSALTNQLTTALVDSAYVQARQVDLQRDSAFVTNIIDSAYITARAPEPDGDGLAFAIALG